MWSQLFEAQSPGLVRVGRQDGTRVDLEKPSIRGDSIVGTFRSRFDGRDATAVRTLPLTEVRTVAVRRFSAGRTLGLVGGVLGALTLAALIAYAACPDDSLTC